MVFWKEDHGCKMTLLSHYGKGTHYQQDLSLFLPLTSGLRWCLPSTVTSVRLLFFPPFHVTSLERSHHRQSTLNAQRIKLPLFQGKQLFRIFLHRIAADFPQIVYRSDRLFIPAQVVTISSIFEVFLVTALLGWLLKPSSPFSWLLCARDTLPSMWDFCFVLCFSPCPPPGPTGSLGHVVPFLPRFQDPALSREDGLLVSGNGIRTQCLSANCAHRRELSWF